MGSGSGLPCAVDNGLKDNICDTVNNAAVQLNVKFQSFARARVNPTGLMAVCCRTLFVTWSSC